MVRARWLVAIAGLLAAALTVIGFTPAGAAGRTVNTQLSLSGLANADNPLGGSVIEVHPGDRVVFRAASAPTAGLDQRGLGGLVGNLLDSAASFQVTADFHRLPGGRANTVLSGSAAAGFTFPSRGTYNFTWTAQNVTLLGAVPINLDGNQLAQAGIKLNASNQYVGQVVVTNTPHGGLGIQLPGVSVAPSVPVLGQLPRIGIPGVSTPRVQLPVSNLAPNTPGKTSGSGKPKSKAGAAAAPAYQPPGLSIPDLVVPKGNGDAMYTGDGGFYTGVLGGSGSQLGPLSPNVISGSSQAQGGTTGKAGTQNSSGKGKTVDLASQSGGSPSSQVPVVLAIIAIIALALVAGTYARLYLMRKQP